MTVETIHWHTLHPRYLGRKSKIIDLGASWGHFSYQIAYRFGGTCVAVEPSPLAFAGIKESRLVLKLQAGVGERTEVLPFNVDEDSFSSALLRNVEPHVEMIDVQIYSLEDLFARLGWSNVDLLKVAIEGAEIGMFDAAQDKTLQSIGQITVEFNDYCGLTSQREVERVLARLRGLGFRSVRMSGVGHQDTWLINQRRLGISNLEMLWIQSVVRNWPGFKRVLLRLLRRMPGLLGRLHRGAV